MFDISSIMMQTLASANIDVVGLLTAIGGIIIAVGSISHSLSQRGPLKKYKEGFESIADWSGDVGHHIIQSKEEMTQLADIVYKFMGSDAQNIVNKQAVRLAELQRKLEQAQLQLGKVPSAIDHI